MSFCAQQLQIQMKNVLNHVEMDKEKTITKV